MLYHDFFKQALKKDFTPYPYQLSLFQHDWPDMIDIPTGLGKTAAIIVSWLYKRYLGDKDTPRRLVYCLPMRVLVEQTVSNAKHWIANLQTKRIYSESTPPSVHVLMGGEVDRDWDIFPEHNQILIGTQDQLLSRALNRGYSISRFRWPIDFGLLNNDCLWVMDEIQLMGEGLATTAQLQAFRNTLKTIYPVRSIWMSATLQKSWLRTVDFLPEVDSLNTLSLTEQDKKQDSMKQILEAPKPIERAPLASTEAKNLARFVLEHHRPGIRTLVVLNTVKRVQELYRELKMRSPKCGLTLIHSRFRPGDRLQAMESLLKTPGKDGDICVATQVIEAGVDVTSSILITDLAPWASLIQRFGRCNRDGLERNAQIFWLNIDLSKKGHAAPYRSQDLEKAREILESLKDAKSSCLPRLDQNPQYLHVVRRRDLIDLFDTTPDLAGSDIDVSRFIRETDDHSLQVFWRDIGNQGPDPEEPAPTREELCTVSLSSFLEVSELRKWRWDQLDKQWIRLWGEREIYPGLTLLLDAGEGCYNKEMGWTGDKKDIPEILPYPARPPEAYDDDFVSSSNWQTLSSHLELVVSEMHNLLNELHIPNPEMKEALLLAARWHDAGKSHPVFQEAMVKEVDPPEEGVLWGKTSKRSIRYSRRGFRHELASALAMIEQGLPDLAVYLAASHHGKVRLSIRSLPNETRPEQPEKRYARGIWDGDLLPETFLGNGTVMPEIEMDLSIMELGQGSKGSSWLSRMIRLRDDPHLGVCNLAYLEALLRIADWRASKKQESEHG
jgi:CRISPR-associated endonuclease/helicase Cas3